MPDIQTIGDRVLLRSLVRTSSINQLAHEHRDTEPLPFGLAFEELTSALGFIPTRAEVLSELLRQQTAAEEHCVFAVVFPHVIDCLIHFREFLCPYDFPKEIELHHCVFFQLGEHNARGPVFFFRAEELCERWCNGFDNVLWKRSGTGESHLQPLHAKRLRLKHDNGGFGRQLVFASFDAGVFDVLR